MPVREQFHLVLSQSWIKYFYCTLTDRLTTRGSEVAFPDYEGTDV